MARTPESWPRPLLRAHRPFKKYVINPVRTPPPGPKNSSPSVIRQTGRKSGKPYSTPVVADRVQDGFIVALPYGAGVDWLQNVLAAGQATGSAKGENHEGT